jgi:hypothetical protein
MNGCTSPENAMDTVFHAAAGTLLASRLGQHRWPYLAAAAVVGALPDLIWGGYCLFKGGWTPLPLAHSIPFTLAMTCVIALMLDWRVALGLPLHVMVDLPLHCNTSFYHLLGIEGVQWHEGRGIIVAVILWIVLLGLLRMQAKALRTRRWMLAGRLAAEPVVVSSTEAQD